MKASSALSDGLISHYPESVHAVSLFSLCPHKCRKNQSQKYLELRRDLFFLSLAIPGFQTGRERKGGCRVSTTISRRGKDAWHSESSGWDSLISPRALSVLEDHYF